MHDPIVLATCYALVLSLFDVVLRSIQKQYDRSWAISLLGSLCGAFLLLLVLDVSFEGMSVGNIALVALSGCLWSVMLILDAKSFVAIDVGVATLLSSTRTLFLIWFGYIFFEEKLTNSTMLAACSIFAGINVAKPFSFRRIPAGYKLRFGAIITGAFAIIVDKILVHRININLVIVFGYLIPGILYLFFKPKDWKKQLSFGWGVVGLKVVLSVFLFTLIGPLFIYAFGTGQLGTTVIIGMSHIVLSMALGAVLLGERDRLAMRLVGTLFVATGMYIALSN